MTMECVNITIHDDVMLERNETFLVSLERTAGLNQRIVLDITEKTVTIVDDDREWFHYFRLLF